MSNGIYRAVRRHKPSAAVELFRPDVNPSAGARERRISEERKSKMMLINLVNEIMSLLPRRACNARRASVRARIAPCLVIRSL